ISTCCHPLLRSFRRSPPPPPSTSPPGPRPLPSFFFSTHPPTTDTYTLSLHDALPIYCRRSVTLGIRRHHGFRTPTLGTTFAGSRSEEHTSELQSRGQLVCRLLLEKKKESLHGTEYEEGHGGQRLPPR